ncbi:unnamed protein product [Mortierella alpina]
MSFTTAKQRTGTVASLKGAPNTTHWIIDFQDGRKDLRRGRGRLNIVSHNRAVEPRSLYWSQLAERTGIDADELRRMNGTDVRTYLTNNKVKKSKFKRLCTRVRKVFNHRVSQTTARAL